MKRNRNRWAGAGCRSLMKCFPNIVKINRLRFSVRNFDKKSSRRGISVTTCSDKTPAHGNWVKTGNKDYCLLSGNIPREEKMKINAFLEFYILSVMPPTNTDTRNRHCRPAGW